MIRAEWTKFSTVRSLPWLAVVAVAASALAALLLVVSLPVTQGRGIGAVPATEAVSAALLGVDVAAIVLMVLTASVAGAVAVLVAVLCPLVAQLVLVASGLPAAPVDGALLRLAAGSALGPGVFAPLGLAAALGL